MGEELKTYIVTLTREVEATNPDQAVELAQYASGDTEVRLQDDPDESGVSIQGQAAQSLLRDLQGRLGAILGDVPPKMTAVLWRHDALPSGVELYATREAAVAGVKADTAEMQRDEEDAQRYPNDVDGIYWDDSTEVMVNFYEVELT